MRSTKRSLGRSGVAGLVLSVVLLAAPQVRAEDPFRLRLVREAADVEAAAEGGSCIRGSLYLVSDFGSGQAGVRIADTLELPAAAPSDVSEAFALAGIHAASARNDEPLGWRIEIGAAGSGRVLRARPGGNVGEVAGAVLVGRRPPGEPVAACDPATEELADGEALMRRLRELYGAPAGNRHIEIRIETPLDSQ